jgi:hypothetical protein
VRNGTQKGPETGEVFSPSCHSALGESFLGAGTTANPEASEASLTVRIGRALGSFASGQRACNAAPNALLSPLGSPL